MLSLSLIYTPFSLNHLFKKINCTYHDMWSSISSSSMSWKQEQSRRQNWVDSHPKLALPGTDVQLAVMWGHQAQYQLWGPSLWGTVGTVLREGHGWVGIQNDPLTSWLLLYPFQIKVRNIWIKYTISWTLEVVLKIAETAKLKSTTAKSLLHFAVNLSLLNVYKMFCSWCLPVLEFWY